MLYNPAWEVQNKPVLSWPRLIAWLEKKPANKRYNYMDAAGCMVAQYLMDQGADYLFDYCLTTEQLDAKLPGLSRVALLGDTFGGALRLARQKAGLNAAR